MPTSLKSPIIYDKECRNGYFVGNGIYRYCREYGNGPGILVGSTKRRRSQQAPLRPAVLAAFRPPTSAS